MCKFKKQYFISTEDLPEEIFILTMSSSYRTNLYKKHGFNQVQPGGVSDMWVSDLKTDRCTNLNDTAVRLINNTGSKICVSESATSRFARKFASLTAQNISNSGGYAKLGPTPKRMTYCMTKEYERDFKFNVEHGYYTNPFPYGMKNRKSCDCSFSQG